jgi:hypothetical protein
MGFNESLISAVYLRPYIYTKADKNHGKRTLIAKAWDEIASEVGDSGESHFNSFALHKLG